MSKEIYKEELKKELGNAIAAYGRILRSAQLGMTVPPEFEHLRQCSDLELTYKIEMLKDFHKSL